MITSETAKMTYQMVTGVTEYAIGFVFDRNPDSSPRIKVMINKASGSPLVYGVDYTISEDQLKVVILSEFENGDRLDIIRDIPMVQISDYVIGRIDPDQIESDFDLSVERDQQLLANIEFTAEIPEDHELRIQELESDVGDLESLVPAQAASDNQLADKEFVNSSIATSTATFRGTYSSVSALDEVTADDNDYAFVESVDAAGNTLYSRYKYSSGTWAFEYMLNNSSFTAAQWAAINSGITAGIVDTFNATGHNVGDIFFTMRNDSTLNGAVSCDGTQYSLTDFSGGESIGQLLSDGKVPYVSLSTYATLLSTNGSVGVFGWDGVGTTAFRVPALNDIFIESGTAAQIGDYIAPGLPNITGTVTGISDVTVSGAFERGARVAGNGGGGGDICADTFDASRSSAIYNSTVTTVQPNSIRYRAVVQLAISATDGAVETCTSVLSDVANLNSHRVIEFQAPTADNNYTWYRKYADGWVEQGGVQIGNSTYGKATVNLPVEMADNTYQAFGNIGWANENGWYTNTGSASGQAMITDVCGATTDKTTTTFSIQSFSTHNWYVCGMAA